MASISRRSPGAFHGKYTSNLAESQNHSSLDVRRCPCPMTALVRSQNRVEN